MEINSSLAQKIIDLENKDAMRSQDEPIEKDKYSSDEIMDYMVKEVKDIINSL